MRRCRRWVECWGLAGTSCAAVYANTWLWYYQVYHTYAYPLLLRCVYAYVRIYIIPGTTMQAVFLSLYCVVPSWLRRCYRAPIGYRYTALSFMMLLLLYDSWYVRLGGSTSTCIWSPYIVWTLLGWREDAVEHQTLEHAVVHILKSMYGWCSSSLLTVSARVPFITAVCPYVLDTHRSQTCSRVFCTLYLVIAYYIE